LQYTFSPAAGFHMPFIDAIAVRHGFRLAATAKSHRFLPGDGIAFIVYQGCMSGNNNWALIEYLNPYISHKSIILSVFFRISSLNPKHAEAG
jgi:hypothetical protein